MEPTFDADGYPTEDTEKTVAGWKAKVHGDFRDLMEYVRKAWRYPNYWSEENTIDELFGRPVIRYHVSTAGWSGNESLIEAMRKNFIFWSLCWVQERRGGHYIFEIPSGAAEAAPTEV